ncbi:rsbT co-antagonist protein RsbR [Novosphingobium sp. B1]|nr:rsbT co-antagonist protein RsbR [Novosphingobium sp. B1]
MPMSFIQALIDSKGEEILEDWLATHHADGLTRRDLFSDAQGRQHAKTFFLALQSTLNRGADIDAFNLASDAWADVRAALAEVTRERVKRGVAPAEIAGFFLLLKYPLFDRLGAGAGTEEFSVVEQVSRLTRMIDAIAVQAMSLCIEERDRIIERQRTEMLEISTPVVDLWERVIAVPLVGTLDSVRAQEVMENTLGAIVDREADIVIVDITGVPTIDTEVAHHLLRTAAAIRLMGAECIISGISPRIAQTMVHLGVSTNGVTTRASLRAAVHDAFQRVGLTVVNAKA